MGKGRVTPTESEWLIMEAVWALNGGDGGDGREGVTSADIIRKIHEQDDMTERTIRVLLTLLCKKGLLGYTVDAHDSRVYHYYAKRTREACLRDKSADFADSYFHGDHSMAAASFLQSVTLTDEQIAELEAILEGKRK